MKRRLDLDERYWEIIKELRKTNSEDYKKLRKIHKELKPYGDGIWWYARYPYLSVWISGIASIISLVVIALNIIARIGM